MNYSNLYDKYYKILLIIPLSLLLLSLIYIAIFYQQNNDFIKKDISLTGGTSLTIYSKEKIDLANLDEYLSEKLTDFSIREITGISNDRQEAVVIESSSEPEILKNLMQDYLGYSLDSENSSTEFTGAFLSEAFYSQLVKSILFAFVLMSLVVFILFRTFVPSFAVILSAFNDIVMTLFVVDFLGINLSSAGVVAFLMLVGYSVDTDIMLASHLLKQKEGEINQKIFSSFMTGLTMTLTSLFAVAVAFYITAGFSEILKQIFIILIIGLSFDIINTWIGTASILKWYLNKKNKSRIITK